MRITHNAGFMSGQSAVGEFPASWLKHLYLLSQNIRENWALNRRNRQDAAQLNMFTDRELWDLGLSRADLPTIARGTYRRD